MEGVSSWWFGGIVPAARQVLPAAGSRGGAASVPLLTSGAIARANIPGAGGPRGDVAYSSNNPRVSCQVNGNDGAAEPRVAQ
jgi:hypothetical protein